MDFGSINPALLIAALMVASTPILLAALGELVVEATIKRCNSRHHRHMRQNEADGT